MTVAPQAETEIVHGVIQGIVQKGADKWQVEVNVGQQNPRRLWTKDAALVGQLSMMIGQTTSFLCGISHWVNQQQQPVRSLWINGVGQGMQQPQPVQQQPMVVQPTAPMQPQQITLPQPQAQPVAQMQQPRSDFVPESVRETRIHRQTASKVAAILISHVPAEQRTLENVLALAERIVAYYENGLMQAAMPMAGDGAGDPGPQGIPQTDDDIPF
jgi:hypothetical protein